MVKRWSALGVVLALAVAMTACGSRTDEKTFAGSGPAVDAGGGGGGGGGGDGGGPPVDKDSPCGPGDASGATDVGVTDTAITIATIQDIGGPVPGLFQGNLDQMKAFVAYCNDQGGILGRKLELLELDSRISEHRSATEQACNDSFALVGSAAALDSGGAEIGVECGIPDLPAFGAETQHAGAANVYAGVPNPPELLVVGPQLYLEEQAPEALESAAMFYVNTPVTKTNADKRIAGYEDIGFDFKVTAATDYPQELNWGPKIEQLRSEDSQFVSMVGDATGMAQMVRELSAQGVEPAWVEFDLAGYDQEFIDEAGPAAEGVHLWVQIVPREESDSSDELQRYLYWLEQTNAKVGWTGLGQQGWSSALLFATAAKALGSDVTREGLFAEIEKITEWDGHGLHGPADVGKKRPSECFLYITVEDGKFVREFPDEGFECSRGGVAEVQYDYPRGAGT
jgi:ABC-type branched-subunit amino acid transport system substrate-binding protein